MKIAVIIYMLIQIASVASAEIYTWEDANGINFSDTPPPLSEEERKNALDETGTEINNDTPPGSAGITEQNRPVVTHQYLTAVYKADPEQQKRGAVKIKQRQTRTSAVSGKIVEETFPSLASLIVAWIIIALFLTIIWIFTIKDIVRSDYETESTKTAWILLVVFIPLIGMLLYYILGASQKINSNSYNEKRYFETFSRFN
ncbi:MAG: PLDc N-terminal domain-containing protein [Desulfuromonadaceae bacterium]|nr:PLDc N-terminal domain-containing protein [Desulfuromonadaceae bacterium]